MNIGGLESHEQERLDENGRLEHQLVAGRVEKEPQRARDVESTTAVTDVKVELAN